MNYDRKPLTVVTGGLKSMWKSTKSNFDRFIQSDAVLAVFTLNVIGMMWACVLKGHPIPDGFGTIVAVVIGGKTIHSVASVGKIKP